MRVVSTLKSGLLLLPLALAACAPVPQGSHHVVPPLTGPTACPIARDEAPAEVARRINELRASRGLPALRYSDHLARIAQNHACDNAANKSYSHEGSNGSTLGNRLATGGYQHLGARENTGLGRFDSAGMVAYWRNSPAHLANILDPSVDELGLGIAATNDGRRAWVMMLAKRR